MIRAFITMAILNVFRNKRRSIQTCIVLMIGLAFVSTARGILNGLQYEIKSQVTKGHLGDIQIFRKGLREALMTKTADFLFESTDQLEDAIKAEPGVEAFSKRLMYGGIINHQKSQTTSPFMGLGIDPEREQMACPRMAQMLIEGSFFKSELEKEGVLSEENPELLDEASVEEDIDFSKPVSSKETHNLKKKVEAYHQVIIGDVLQKGFASVEKDGSRKVAQIGDELVLLVKDTEETQQSISAHITGINNNPSPDANKMLIMTTLSTAQKLMAAKNKITHLVIRVKEGADRFVVAKQLEKKIGRSDLEVVPWDDIQKFFSTVMQLQNIIFSIVMSVIILIVVSAIAITSMMIVSERTREIGTLMAIGYKRYHLISLFLIESSFIGIVGGISGLLLGILIVAIAGQIGISFNFPGSSFPIIIRPFITPTFSCGILAAGWLSAVLASLHPAYTASRMAPLKALGKT